MGRAPCCDKANVKKGPWSPEEDAKLKAYIEEKGTGGNWIALPQKIGLKRCGKSCRLRWLNYLRPNIKHGGFSEEEDNIICSLYISIGSRWSIIAAQLPGRTDNDIKNYWNTKLKKKLLGRRKESQSSRCLSSVSQESKEGGANGMNYDSSSQALSASAMERIQLHMQLQGLHSTFSFYNNPALWPKSHPLREQIPTTTPTINVDTSQKGSFPNNPELANCAVECNMGVFDTSSLNGFSSPSSSAAFNVEQSSANFNSVAGLQAELNDLLYGKSGCFGGEGDRTRVSDLQCFGETDVEKESMVWWDNNGFGGKSSSSSWDSALAMQPESMFQDQCMLGYDL